MEKLKDFMERIPAKGLKLLAVCGLILSVFFDVMFEYFFILSGDSVNPMASQLSFSDMFLRAEYSQISNVVTFKIAQGLDYGFMFSYASLIFSLALIMGSKFGKDAGIRHQSYFIALSGPAAACGDAFENLFIFLTVGNPQGFPTWQAIAMSIASTVKWVLLFTAISWAIVVTLYYFIVIKRKN
ncbi:MAG TPA: hypothetical protein VKM55_29240 [Candidatus Lokiarchaeia archaeon]|nr:hypothetical protein [Candidatus Lokiarchaeia archaeon]